MKTIRQLQALHTFKEVALNKSFSMAAKKLGVSKAHISKTIQEYEDYLGQSLFERTTRTVKLTYAGENLWLQCSGPLDQLGIAAETLRLTGATPRGPLRVSLAGAFGEEQVIPVLSRLAISHPELKIEANFTTRKVNLVQENIDVAIRVGSLEELTSSAVQIAVRQEFTCASPAYLKRMGRPKKPLDLHHHNCMVGSFGAWSFLDKKKQINLKLAGNFTSNNGRALLSAAVDGVGICRLPGVYVKALLHNGTLEPLLQEYMPKSVPIWAISTEHRLMSPNVQTFLSALKDHLSLQDDHAF